MNDSRGSLETIGRNYFKPFIVLEIKCLFTIQKYSIHLLPISCLYNGFPCCCCLAKDCCFYVLYTVRIKNIKKKPQRLQSKKEGVKQYILPFCGFNKKNVRMVYVQDEYY